MNPNFAFPILVPVDFTEKTLNALDYAASMVQNKDGMIHLLHVIDERSEPGDNVLRQIKEKTTQFARQHQERLGTNIVPNVVTGNIFISIGETARKLGAQIIVMGIHGIHGIQFIIGSFAARVILGSQVPVILVNGKKKFSGFEKLLLPIDNFTKMGELVRKTIEIGKISNSTIHVFSRNVDLPLMKKVFFRNQRIKIQKQIKKAGLNCQNITIDKANETFSDALLEYAKNIDADLIMVTTNNRPDSKENIIVETGIGLMEKSTTPLFFLNSGTK